MTSWKGNIHGDVKQLDLFLYSSVRINNARIRIVWIKSDSKFIICTHIIINVKFNVQIDKINTTTKEIIRVTTWIPSIASLILPSSFLTAQPPEPHCSILSQLLDLSMHKVHKLSMGV
jgi:hypothetical protein